MIAVKWLSLGGVRGVMVIVVGNGHATRVQILDEIDCISHSTNTLGTGMNPIILQVQSTNPNPNYTVNIETYNVGTLKTDVGWGCRIH